MDHFTKMLTVELIMYNGNNRYLCNLVVEFEFTEGGNILVEYSAEAANSQPYWYDSDDNGAQRAYNLRIIFESIFVLLVFGTLVIEVVELIQCVIATGSVKGYFASIWNYVDVFSIALFCVSIAMWGAMVTQFNKFDTLHRYDVYLNNNQAARLLELKAGGAAMQDFVSAVNDFNAIMATQVVGTPPMTPPQ